MICALSLKNDKVLLAILSLKFDKLLDSYIVRLFFESIIDLTFQLVIFVISCHDENGDSEQEAIKLYNLTGNNIPGNCSPESPAATNVLGELCTSRWLTYASRVLRLYISCSYPHNLANAVRTLAKYIVTVYYRVSIIFTALGLF